MDAKSTDEQARLLSQWYDHSMAKVPSNPSLVDDIHKKLFVPEFFEWLEQ
jgi:hypothetical protein